MTKRTAATGDFSARAGKFVFFVSFAIFICDIQQTNTADIDVLLALRTSANVPFGDWYNSNTSTYCTWQGITCNSNGRIEGLEIPGNATSRPLRGSIPANLADLTALKVLILSSNLIYGTLPTALFLSPIIDVIDVVNTGLTVNLPPVLSSSLRVLSLGDTKLSGPMSEMNWPGVDLLDLSATYISCPLPAGWVNFSRSGGRIPLCFWRGAFLTIDDDNILCGQIPIGNFSCDLGAIAQVGAYFPQNVRPAAVDLRVEFEQMTIEFIKDEVFFFAAYNRSDGTRNEFRGEYISFKSRPLSQLYDGKYRYNFNQTRFDKFLWETPNRLRVNMTKVENLQFELVFDFNSSRASGAQVAIKFSFVIYNLGYVWRNPDPDIDFPILNINLLVNYKLQHSPENGPPIVCPRGSTVYKECKSDTAFLFTIFDLVSGEQVVGAQSQKTEMSFSYPPDGIIDGRQLGGITASNLIIVGSRMLWPLPSAEYLVSYSANNLTAPSGYMPLADQSLVIPLQLRVPRIIRRLDYDPDVSISLLFNPEQPTPSSAPTLNVSQDIVVGVAVGVTIAAVIVIALGATVFAKVIFPYMKKRNESRLTKTELDEEKHQQPEKKATWTRSTIPGPDTSRH